MPVQIEQAPRQTYTPTGELPLRVTEKVANNPRQREVLTLRGLRGTFPELVQTPKAAAMTLLVADSILFDHAQRTNLISPDTRQKTADVMAEHRTRLHEEMFTPDMPYAIRRNAYFDAARIIVEAAAINAKVETV